MARVIYIAFDGKTTVVEVANGLSVMQGAVANRIAGITGECEGAMACGTCHVYVDPDWLERTGSPSENEKAMLDFAIDVAGNSRLSCQIRVGEAMDGLIVRMPEKQSA
jgi:2Fe-2S ferredoxin